MTGILGAAYAGDVEAVGRYLSDGGAVDVADSCGWTMLHFACLKGHMDIVIKLIENGADVNAADIFGRKIFYSACRNGHMDIVIKLIENGANVNTADNCRWSPLHSACQKGYMGIVIKLIENGADVNAADIYGQTPLYIACRNGHADIADLLVQRMGLPKQGREDYDIEGSLWLVRKHYGYIIIGCQCHRAEDWAAFDDEKISRMHSGASAFWRRHRTAILNWAGVKTA